jgi:glycosyltransferase involved in cell wall biosynthesis
MNKSINLKSKNILIVQRVLTKYRFDLLNKLNSNFKKITFITSKGNPTGSLKLNEKLTSNNDIKIINSLSFNYSGESRRTTLFFYPHALIYIFSSDIIVLEGATNLLNNIFFVPIAKIFKKKIIWWDAGYSLKNRTNKRKIIDFFVKPLVRLTDMQIAYSSMANKYMQEFMGAENCYTLLNTINTDYFKGIIKEVHENNSNYIFNPKSIKILYVGAIEKRKNIKQLIDMVARLNHIEDKIFFLEIIGDGDQYDTLIDYVKRNEYKNINFYGAISDLESLKPFYFSSDVLILPGDGGLAIVQSLLFGLPVLCILADGTEQDYLNDIQTIFNNLDEIEKYLYVLNKIDRIDIKEIIGRLSSDRWINNFLHITSENLS